nr:hypothetical protein [uncultured Glaciecola sp.]
MSKVVFILLFFSVFSAAEEGVFYINGEAVKKISLALTTNAIDFGDVYNDSEVDSILTEFWVNAEAGYDYTVEISNDDETGVLEASRNPITGFTQGSITYIDTATGADQRHEFYVDLNTAIMSDDIAVTITVMVAYNDIHE